MYQGKHVQKKADTAAPAPETEESHPAPERRRRQEETLAAVRSSRPHKRKKTKKQRWRKALIILLAVLAVLGSLYGVFVFSNIPVIKKWRTIYIETAMATLMA